MAEENQYPEPEVAEAETAEAGDGEDSGDGEDAGEAGEGDVDEAGE